MIQFVANEQPFILALWVSIPLACNREYFACVDFVAEKCANGTYRVEVTDADVYDFIDGRAAEVKYAWLSKETIDKAQSLTLDPIPPTP